MLPFRRILFPVDYSEPCRAVVPYVKEMARCFSAEVTLVHAYGEPWPVYVDLVVADPELPGRTREFEEQRLRGFALEWFPGQRMDTFAELGEAGAVIHDVIQRQGTDLVMMPTHGRGPVRRFLVGSVTAKVLHDVTAAVWTVTSSAMTMREPGGSYKSVLCALEENEEAAGILKAAAAIAGAYGAQLSIVHVLETIKATVDFDLSPYKKQLMDDANFKLRELKARSGIDAPHAVIDASIAGGVRQEAIRRNADLVVTGRGLSLGLVSRMWSSLYSIVRDSPCPVLSI